MNDELNFNFDDGNDISSSSTQNGSVEDIVSDSSYNHAIGRKAPQEPVNAGLNYKKKKKGFAGWLDNTSYKFKRWWSRLKKGQKTAIITLTSIILVIVMFLVWFFIYFNYNYNRLDTDDLGFDGVINEKVINIALFGIDTRDEKSFKGLSDSMMIMSLNTETKKVKLISLMRDTLVPIEKDGKTTYNKLTTAYANGGPELAIKTINQNFGLDISDYATVNFYGMADIIDAVGGIDADLTDREVTARGLNNYGINDMIEEICEYMDCDPKDYYITVSGHQHLNGIQAVAYARIRYVPNVWGTSNDYGRTDRQRYVMEQLFNAATKMNKSQYIKLAKALIPCSETSLTYGDIINLAVNILLHSPKFEQARVPQNDWLMTAPSGSFGSVVYFDLAYAEKAIKSIIYDDTTMDQFLENNPIEKNDWYAKRNSSGGKGNGSTAGTSGNTSGAANTSSDISQSSDTSSKPSITIGGVGEGGGNKEIHIDATTGSTTSGNTSSGNTSSGNTSSGNTSSGNTSSGNTSSGNTSSGNTSSGNTSSGNTSSGNTSSGDTSSGSSTPQELGDGDIIYDPPEY